MVTENQNSNESIKKILMQESKCKCLSTEGVLLTLSAGKAVSADLYVLFCMCAIPSCITVMWRKKDKPVWPPTSCSCCDNGVSDARQTRAPSMSQKTAADISVQLLLQVDYMNTKSLGRQLGPPLCVFTRIAEHCNWLTVKRKRKSSQLFLKSNVL